VQHTALWGLKVISKVKMNVKSAIYCTLGVENGFEKKNER